MSKDDLDVDFRDPPEDEDASEFLEGGENGSDKQSEDKEDEPVRTTIYFDADVRERLDEYCDAEGRKMSWTANRAVKLFLEEEGY